MEVLQTHIVKTNIVAATLGMDPAGTGGDYAVVFECEKNHWFLRIGNQLKPISPECAIHITCSK